MKPAQRVVLSLILVSPIINTATVRVYNNSDHAITAEVDGIPTSEQTASTYKHIKPGSSGYLDSGFRRIQKINFTRSANNSLGHEKWQFDLGKNYIAPLKTETKIEYYGWGSAKRVRRKFLGLF